MKTVRTMNTMNTVRVVCTIAAACVACCFTGCIDDEDESENLIFFGIYNSDGTLGAAGMTSEEWETILWRLSDGCTIVFASDMTSEDLAAFLLALKVYNRSNVTIDMSKMAITYIDSYTFSNCTAISGVVIGESVVSIKSNAFYGCSSLKTVYYKGTKSAWNSISISSTGNSYLTSATIICTDGTYSE